MLFIPPPHTYTHSWCYTGHYSSLCHLCAHHCIVSIPFCKLEWWCCLCRRYFKWRRNYKQSLNRTREELENEIIIEPNYCREAQEPPAPYSQLPSQQIDNVDGNPSANPNFFEEVMLTYADIPPPDPPRPTQRLTREGPPTYIDTVTN